MPDEIVLGPGPHFVKTNAQRARGISLKVIWPETVAEHRMRDRYVRVKGRVKFVYDTSDMIDVDGVRREPGSWGVAVSDGTGEVEAMLLSSQEEPHREGDEVAFCGRLVLQEWGWSMDGSPLTLDPNASRFHPASVAGLIVGTMGAFVFALYLLSWLRARWQPVAPK
jgi:hypothetical protein